jgi:hypothetical protein
LPAHVRVFSTFQVPFLTIIKSEDRALPPTIIDRLGRMRRALPANYRRDLFDLRMFFRLGGLRNDPFRARRAWQPSRMIPEPSASRRSAASGLAGDNKLR